MTTIDYNWTEAPPALDTHGPNPPLARSWALLQELAAVFEGMFIQVAPAHHDALDSRLRRDMGLE